MPEHVAAIRQHGPCPQHRRTFKPVREWFPVEGAEEGEAAGAGTKKRAAASGGRGGRKKKAADA